MISAELAAAVAAAVAAAPARIGEDDLAADLRRRFAGLRITVCSDDLLPPRLTPALENDACRIYYLDASEHCVKLTRDPDAAAGLVVGLCDERAEGPESS